MTLEEIRNLKKGDNLYVLVVNRGCIGRDTGNRTIGKDWFNRYDIKKLKVEDVVFHNYDPDGIATGWISGCTSCFIKVDTSVLTDEERDLFYNHTYDWFKFYKWTDDNMYGVDGITKEYLEFRLNNDGTVTQSMQDDYDIVSKTKKGAEAYRNKLYSYSLKYVDNQIKSYKETKQILKKWFNENK